MLDYAAPAVTVSHRHAAGSRRAGQCRPPAAARLFRARARAARRRAGQLLVPDRAIGSDQSGRYLLVAGKDDVVEQRTVEIGQLVGELRVIASGIKPDDRVVISGPAVGRARPEDRAAAEDRQRSGQRRRRAMISKFFIERPVLANVIAILMVVIGIVSLLAPAGGAISQRGAADRLGDDPLSRRQRAHGDRHGGAADRAAGERRRGHALHAVLSPASDGSYSLTVTFAIGTDLNAAQVLVQNRVSSAMAALPQSVQVQGVNVQKKSTAILEIVTLTSPDGRHDSLYLSNYATIRLKDEIARLPGVGNVNVFGAGQYSMRVWLDPDKMQARGLTAQDVIQALQQQSEQVTAGQVGRAAGPRRTVVPVHDRRGEPPRRSRRSSAR